jgi:hypothetical protein
MVQLPPGQGYTQPTVVDVHACPCVYDPNNPTVNQGCVATADATHNAATLYSDVWGFLEYRGLTSALAVFGESSPVGWNSALCGWEQDPNWVVNGYVESSLYQSHASATVFSPFNNIANSCYSNPVTLAPH